MYSLGRVFYELVNSMWVTKGVNNVDMYLSDGIGKMRKDPS
jgi:hypothetical protein